MDLQVETVPQNDERWLKFVDHAHLTLFQTPRWCELIAAEYGFSARVALVLADSKVVGGLPYAEVDDFRGLRRVAFAFSDFCEPLGDAAAWPVIEAALCAEGVPWQIRSRALPSPRAADSLGSPGVQQSIKLPLTITEATAAFHQKQRVNISRLLRAGATCRKVADAGFVEPFYSLFTTLRKRKFRLLPQAKTFFDRLVATYFPERGFGLLAEIDGKAIAAMVLLSEGDTLYVKYSASDPDVLTLRPNNFLFAKAIEEGILGGYSRLDLGISNEEGLQRFKRHLGAESIPYYVACYAQRPKSVAVLELENALLSLTHILTEPDVPLSAATGAGAALYRFFV